MKHVNKKSPNPLRELRGEFYSRTLGDLVEVVCAAIKQEAGQRRIPIDRYYSREGYVRLWDLLSKESLQNALFDEVAQKVIKRLGLK